MSRIYNDSLLTNLPVETLHVDHWPMKVHEEKGPGVLLEGVIQGKSRYMIVDSKGTKFRYFVFHVKVLRAHRRKFTADGSEMTPNFSQTKKVSTGYLMSSYKSVSKGTSDCLDDAAVRNLVHKDFLADLTKKHNTPDAIPFWIPESQIEQLDIDIGNEVRLKSKGDSAIIEQLCRVEKASKTVSNYAGDEAVGSTWTDKVLANVGGGSVSQNEGVDEDEWDD